MSAYRGRFAPSPTGPLHFGSLVAALGSWLDARSNQGEWLVRIEDIDPPREVSGAADDILRTLENYGLYWDHEVLYQSSQYDYYQQLLQQLLDDNFVYRCNCTRKQIKATGGIYSNHCRNKSIKASDEHSLRLKVINPLHGFDDCFQGQCDTELSAANEDFIVRRKDGLYAYMLAVVADDFQQQITHVIRGADLLDTTTQQLCLFNSIKAKPPVFGHLPLVVNSEGLKLSKQNHALPVNVKNASECLWQSLAFLKQSPPESIRKEEKETQLNWAIENWRPAAFAGKMEITHQDH